MKSSHRSVRLFIGSSTEGLDIAYALQENLEYDVETTVWSQGFFDPSKSFLGELIDKLDDFDLALMVFSPDDLVKLRGQEYRAARDNVVFELGLFCGRLGRERCFFVMPRDAPDFRLPTDLLGIVPLTFMARRSDGNLVAALGSAANHVRRAIRSLALSKHSDDGGSTRYVQLPTLVEFIEAWNGPALGKARSTIRSMPLGEYGPEREALGEVFAFLESVSDAILAGKIDESEAKRHFGEAIPGVWSVAFTELAPPNHADEWWDPLPKMATVSQRWKK